MNNYYAWYSVAVTYLGSVVVGISWISFSCHLWSPISDPYL